MLLYRVNYVEKDKRYHTMIQAENGLKAAEQVMESFEKLRREIEIVDFHVA